MNVEFHPSFVKDLRNLQGSSIYGEIWELVFEEIPLTNSLSEIKNVKRLKKGNCIYRIRVGDYRIGFAFKGNTITFMRVLHRREIYRYFP